jgi:hypothetical protein
LRGRVTLFPKLANAANLSENGHYPAPLCNALEGTWREDVSFRAAAGAAHALDAPRKEGAEPKPDAKREARAGHIKTKPSPTPYALVAVGIPAYVIGGPRDRPNGFVCSKAAGV